MSLFGRKQPETVIMTAVYEDGEKVEEQVVVVKPESPRVYWWWPVLTVFMAWMMMVRM